MPNKAMKALISPKSGEKSQRQSSATATPETTDGR